MKNLYRGLIVALVAIALISGGASLAAVKRSVVHEPSRDVIDRVMVKGGPFRLGPDVYAHANETHAVVGVESIELVNCNLVIHHDWELGERVMSAIVDEDETISRLGIQAGISGGGNKSTVYLYKDGKKICANDDRFGAVSNVWVNVTTVKPN